MADEHYIFSLSNKVARKHAAYKNRFGITIAADLYTPIDMDGNTRYPAVVIGPPYSGVKEQGPGVYANELAQAGFVALAFDPSYNGESGGEPRHVSSPDIFTEDFMAGVDYLGTRGFVDRDKIAALGICGSGGFALSAASVDVRIRAVVTASMVDISGNAELFYTPEMKKERLQLLAQKRYEDFGKSEAEVIPSFPAEPENRIPSGLDPMGAEFWSFYAMKRGHHPNARGGFTTTSDYSFFNFQLLNHIEEIAPRKVMIIAGEKAQTRGLSEQICSRMQGNAELVIVPGANHVDLYDDVSKIPFDRIEAFLKQNLALGGQE
ncbi:MAG TPA: alpha/beta hydrolase [Lachnospiraceae bacterium]|nr:alpha/beta hydrolase [Lachnospiraceae bacterium]HUM84012.1 alpha/beta hydrolase [Lachnospiraceae bacterium]